MGKITGTDSHLVTMLVQRTHREIGDNSHRLATLCSQWQPLP